MDDAARGSAALAAGNFSLAIQHYTTALTTHPHAVDYYIKRSTAYTRTTPPKPLLALADADAAVVLATKRGKRELIAQAQLRRAIALFGAERWADAQRCLGWARTLTPKEKEASLSMWEAKIEGKVAVAEEKGTLAEAVVQEVPDVSVAELGGKAVEKKETLPTAGGADQATAEKKDQNAPKETKPAAWTQGDTFRWDWYQSRDAVTVDLMVKGIPKDATLEILPRSISVSFTSSGAVTFAPRQLFARIDPAQSTAKIMSTKVEWILKKAVPGEMWKDFQEDLREAPNNNADQATVKPSVPAASGPVSTAPSYPTSSKSGPKDWDKVAQDLLKRSKAETEPAAASSTTTAASDPATTADEPAADDDDENDGGDPVNGFFKKLFRNADPDTRRAMMKSYQESNGTALSTNWDEVGKAPVQTAPPDGMVARKWGE